MHQENPGNHAEIKETPQPGTIAAAPLDKADSGQAANMDESFLRLQRDLAVALSSTSDLDLAVRTCLGAAMECSGMDCGLVYLYEDDRSLKLVATLGLVLEPSISTYQVQQGSHFSSAIQMGQPLYLENSTSSSIRPREMHDEGIRSLAILPFGHMKKTIGCLCVASHERSNVAHASRIALEGMAAQIGGAITRLKSEVALRSSERRYRLLTENLKDVVFVLAQDGTLSYCSPAVREFGGYDPEEEIGAHMSRYTARHEDLEKSQMALQILLTERRPVTFDILYRPKDRPPFPAELTGFPFQESDGTISIHGVMRDISERKRIEAALRASENLYRTTIDALDEPVFVIDTEFRLTLYNRAFVSWRAYYGLGEPSIGDQLFEACPFLPLKAQEDYKTIFIDAEPISRHDTISVSNGFSGNDPSGNDQHIQTRKIPVLKKGRTTRIVTVVRDLTKQVIAQKKRHELEERLQATRKLESIGRLVGGIAHEFSNQLSPILGYSELALMKMSEDDPLHSYIQPIWQAGNRARDLTQQLLAFGRKQMLQMYQTDLNRITTDLEPMLRRIIGEDITLHLRLCKNPWPLLADPSQIQQILLNLLANSRDAMPHGGNLSIETANVTHDTHQVPSFKDLPRGRYVMLKVTDAGIGMDKSTRNRAFEPFYTTKERGPSTGLGLSTVHGLVQQHNGAIHLHSSPGEGTAVTILFPRCAQGKDSPPPQPPPEAMEVADKTILLLEDDAAVRNLLQEVLLKRGYRVLVAGDAAEALRMDHVHTGPIHLLLTDVILPHSNGKEIYERISRNRPDLKVLFISGYPANVIGHHGVLEQGVYFLHKPFTLGSLIRKLQAILH